MTMPRIERKVEKKPYDEMRERPQRELPKGSIQADATRQRETRKRPIGGGAHLLRPDPSPREQMTGFLRERQAAEESAKRVGSPDQQRAARDSTMRGLRNLMRR